MSEFVEIRFKLHTLLDAELLRHLANRANGCSINKAAYLSMVEWAAMERVSTPHLLYREDNAPIINVNRTTSKSKGYVYLIQADLPNSPCKIGRSVNVPNRLKTFGLKLPFDVEILHIIPCDDCHEAEHDLQEMYSGKQINGEWFELNEKDITAIQSLEKYQEGLYL